MTPYIVQLHQAIAAKPQTKKQLAQALGWPISRAYRLTNELRTQGLIKAVGNAEIGFVYGVVA